MIKKGLFIPKGDLFRHFLRGLMDGDGSIQHSHGRWASIKFAQGLANTDLVLFINDPVTYRV